MRVVRLGGFGFGAEDSAQPGELPSTVRCDRMSDDAKFILGFG
jgi:hypothetical protein